jgi:hypothetical protein
LNKVIYITGFIVISIFFTLFSCKTTITGGSHMHRPESDDWTTQFDFDGDGNRDTVQYSYSGGAHCCYTIAVELSGSGFVYNFPFEMDGGYEYGLDLSKPGHFNIRDYDNDGLPEIFMEINTYNGEKYPLPDEWIQEYGIKTNYIIIEYENKEMTVRDSPAYISVE